MHAQGHQTHGPVSMGWVSAGCRGPVAKGKSASVPSASPPCKQGDALIFKAFSDFEGLFYRAHSQSWALLSEGLSAN